MLPYAARVSSCIFIAPQEPEVVEDFHEEQVPAAQQVAASTTEALIRAAPLQAVKQDLEPAVEPETPRSVAQTDTHQSNVPYVIHATDLATHAVTRAMISECPTSVVVSEAGSPHPEHQQLEGFIQDTIGRSTEAAAAETEIIPEEGVVQPFVSELAQDMTQEAVDNLDTQTNTTHPTDPTNATHAT